MASHGPLGTPVLGDVAPVEAEVEIGVPEERGEEERHDVLRLETSVGGTPTRTTVATTRGVIGVQKTTGEPWTRLRRSEVGVLFVLERTSFVYTITLRT